MKAKTNFKTGFLIGNFIGILILIFGYYSFQKISEKAENAANIDLHQLEYQDLDGNEIKLSDFKGKHILINFWATWCAPCIKEFPELNEAYKELNDDFIFIMVSDESIDKIKKFAANKPYLFVFAKTNNLMVKGITFVPQTFVLGKDGNTIKYHPTIFEGSASSITNTIKDWAKN